MSASVHHTPVADGPKWRSPTGVLLLYAKLYRYDDSAYGCVVHLTVGGTGVRDQSAVDARRMDTHASSVTVRAFT